MSVLGDVQLQSRVLEDLTEAVNYRSWQAALAEPFLGDRPLEIGSGNGDFAATLESRGRALSVSEAERSRLADLRSRFRGSELVTVRELTVPVSETADYSAVFAFNVLEHIPNDVGALASFAGLVEDGGRVIIFVPAFNAAMSRFDRAIGHQRRYTRRSLTSAMNRAGLRVVHDTYVNMIGLPAWYVGMKLLGMHPKSGPLLRCWDTVVMPRMERLEASRPPLFGQSVLCVGQRD